MSPTVEIRNRQRGCRIAMKRLRRLCDVAVPLAAEKTRRVAGLPELIDVSIVSDRRIAELHVRFLNIEGTTDVLTFPYGEIVVSADTAAREGLEHGHSTEEELTLYIIHGVLHLGGWDDRAKADAKDMHRAQHSILKAVVASV